MRAAMFTVCQMSNEVMSPTTSFVSGKQPSERGDARGNPRDHFSSRRRIEADGRYDRHWSEDPAVTRHVAIGEITDADHSDRDDDRLDRVLADGRKQAALLGLLGDELGRGLDADAEHRIDQVDRQRVGLHGRDGIVDGFARELAGIELIFHVIDKAFLVVGDEVDRELGMRPHQHRDHLGDDAFDPLADALLFFTRVLLGLFGDHRLRIGSRNSGIDEVGVNGGGHKCSPE